MNLETVEQMKVSDPKPFLQELTTQAKQYLADANALVVRTEDDASGATLKQEKAKQFVASLEKQRHAIVDDLKKKTKEIDAMFAEPRVVFENTGNVYGRKVGYFWSELKRVADEKAAKENKQLEVNYQKRVDRAVEAKREAPPPPPKVEVHVSKQVGVARIREGWEYEVVNIQMVPAKYLEVKHGDILRALAVGENVPGIIAKKVSKAI